MEMLTVTVVLILAAFVCAVVSACTKLPLWVAVILLCIVELVRVLPAGK